MLCATAMKHVSTCGRVVRGAALVALLTVTSGCEKKAPPDLHLQRAYALLQTDPKSSLIEFDQVREKSSKQALIGRALAYEGLRKYSEAKGLLEQALQRQDEPPIHLLLARVELMLGNIQSAQQHIDRFLQARSDDLSGLLLASCLATNEKRSEAALAKLDTWKPTPKGENASEPAEYQLARASLFARLGRKTEQKRAIRAAAEKRLSDASDTLALALLAARAGQRAFSLSLLERLLTSTQEPEQLLQIGELAHRLRAQRLVTRALDVLPENHPGRALLQARHDAAIQAPSAPRTIREALSTNSDQELEKELRLALAEALLRAGDLDLAKDEAEKLLSISEQKQAATLLLARIELAAERPSTALELIEPLGKTPGARELAALALFELKRPDEALKLARELLDESANNRVAARLLVSIELQADRQAALTQELERRVSKSPTSLGLRLLWLQVLKDAGPPERLTAALQNSVKAQPAQVQLWLMLARQLEENGQAQEALRALRTAHQENPSEPLLTAALAATLTRHAKGEEAAPLYAEILKSSDGDLVALNNLAMFYVDSLRDAKRAVKLAEKAHSLAPDEAAIVDTLAWCLFRRAAPTDAERALKLLEPVQRKLTSPTARYHLAAILIANGKDSQGKKLLQALLASSSEFPQLEEARQLLAQGT